LSESLRSPSGRLRRCASLPPRPERSPGAGRAAPDPSPARAEAVRHYRAQRDFGVEAQNDAAEIKLRAERRLGGLLKDNVRHQGGRPAKGSHDVTVLPEGVRKMDSHRWQRIASVPEGEFEEHVAERRGKLVSDNGDNAE